MKNKKLFFIIVIMFGFFLIAFIYLNDYYHADLEALEYLKSNEKVQVEKIKYGYFFDGFGTNRAIIFYPGAKVETEAYAPVLNELAENGIDCFLLNMPFKIAFFGINRASNIINNYNYEYYTLAGHSLGGVAATAYVKENNTQIDSIIYLASFPNNNIPDNIKMLFIYGDNDNVLSKDSYEKSKIYWTDNYIENIIEGGNHAGFGMYGNQKGDGQLKITSEEQCDITIQKILEFIK